MRKPSVSLFSALGIAFLDMYKAEYDYGLWRQFINLFPHSHLSSIFRGYLIYMQLPLSNDDDSDDVNTSEKGAPEAADIGYDMIMVFVLSFIKIALKLETAGGL